MEEIIIPSKPFTLKDAKEEKKVLFKVPETTMLRLYLVDKDSGEKLKDISLNCTNQDGFVFPVFKRKVMVDGQRQPYWKPDYDDEDRLLFRQLPPGKYTMFARGNDIYPASSVNFEIPEKEQIRSLDICRKSKNEENEIEYIDLKFELEKGARIIFNLPEKYNPKTDHIAYIGYHLADLESEEPVLINEEGPYWGGALHFHKGDKKKVFLALHPGEYILNAVLRERQIRSRDYDKTDPWTYVSKVTIKKGKDIDIKVELLPSADE